MHKFMRMRGLVWLATVAAVVAFYAGAGYVRGCAAGRDEALRAAARPAGSARQATGPSAAEAIRGVRTPAAPEGQDPAEAIESGGG